MHKEMRRKDREISQEEAFAVLEAAEYGILATVGADAKPYAIPVSHVVLEEKIYFHCAPDVGHKLENIRENPAVCFTVVGQTQVLPEKFSTNYESAVVFGTAAPVEGETKAAALIAIIQKFSPEFYEAGLQYIERAGAKTAIYEITPQQLTGKAKR